MGDRVSSSKALAGVDFAVTGRFYVTELTCYALMNLRGLQSLYAV